MKYLNVGTGSKTNKIFKEWVDILRDFEIESSRQYGTHLLQLSKALAEKWMGRKIVLLVDEITRKVIVSKLGAQIFPDSVRMVLVLNPKESRKSLTVSPSILHVTLRTPYRSTIAITSLTRFIAKCQNLAVPYSEFGSDVEGVKPIFFDVGTNYHQIDEVLLYCRRIFGKNATVIYDDMNTIEHVIIDNSIKKQGKQSGGSWDTFISSNFYGWEAERVIAMTWGQHLMELITRAKSHLAVVLFDVDTKDLAGNSCDYFGHYAKTQKYLHLAAEQGLVEWKFLPPPPPPPLYPLILRNRPHLFKTAMLPLPPPPQSPPPTPPTSPLPSPPQSPPPSPLLSPLSSICHCSFYKSYQTCQC